MLQDETVMYCNKAFRLDYCGCKEKLGQFHVLSEICEYFFCETIGMSEYLILWEERRK